MPDAGSRPDWSVVIPTYECADLLDPCLRSVLAAQDERRHTEVVVVDDRSTDRPEDVVERIGAGRVEFRRNAENQGAVGNFNACLDAATGSWIHLLHGDDLVDPGFYEAAGRVFDEHPEVDVFVCRVTYVDDTGSPAETTRSEVPGSGVWTDALEANTISNRVRPCGIAARREVYDRVGGFRTDLPHGADWEMWVRMAASSTIWFEDRPLARYRRHDASDTAARVLTGANIDERLVCVDIIVEHVPEQDRRGRARRAHLYSTAFAVRLAGRLLRQRQFRGALAQLRGAGRTAMAAARA